MNFDFTSLPATSKEALSVDWNKRKYIKVPSLTDGDCSKFIHSQDEGERYMQNLKSKFSSMDELKQWQDRYCALKLKWCQANTSE